MTKEIPDFDWDKYDAACKRAAHNQNLGAFLDAEGWTVEQTGGFTMVAVRYMGEECWTVIHDGNGYLAARQSVENWTDLAEELGDDAYSVNLSLDDALALGPETKPLGNLGDAR